MTNELPVDLDQLNLVSNNDPYDRSFLISIYLRETEKDIERMKEAVKNAQVKEVYRLSHGCAGASLSYGMTALVPALREMEDEARAGVLLNAPRLLDEVDTQFSRLNAFLLTLPDLAEKQSKAA